MVDKYKVLPHDSLYDVGGGYDTPGRGDNYTNRCVGQTLAVADDQNSLYIFGNRPQIRLMSSLDDGFTVFPLDVVRKVPSAEELWGMLMDETEVKAGDTLRRKSGLEGGAPLGMFEGRLYTVDKVDLDHDIVTFAGMRFAGWWDIANFDLVSRATAHQPAPEPERCGAGHSTNESWIPCQKEPGHTGDHWSTSGCRGGEVFWSPEPEWKPGTVAVAEGTVNGTTVRGLIGRNDDGTGDVFTYWNEFARHMSITGHVPDDARPLVVIDPVVARKSLEDNGWDVNEVNEILHDLRIEEL